MNNLNPVNGAALKLSALAATVALTSAATVLADDTNPNDCYVPGPLVSCCFSSGNTTFVKDCNNGSLGFTCTGIIVSDDDYQPQQNPVQPGNGWTSSKWSAHLGAGPTCEYRAPVKCIFTGAAPDCTYTSFTLSYYCPEFVGGDSDCTLVYGE